MPRQAGSRSSCQTLAATQTPNMRTRTVTLLGLLLLPIAGFSAEQESSAEKFFMAWCVTSVNEIYSDPEIEALFPSVPDAVSMTCRCVASRVSSDSQLLSSYQRLNNLSSDDPNSKKLNAYVSGRFLVGALSCMANDLDRASKGIGPRGVG